MQQQSLSHPEWQVFFHQYGTHPPNGIKVQIKHPEYISIERKSERHLLEDMQRHCFSNLVWQWGSLLEDLSAVIAATLGILPNQSSNLRKTAMYKAQTSWSQIYHLSNLQHILNLDQHMVRIVSSVGFNDRDFSMQHDFLTTKKCRSPHYSSTTIALSLPHGIYRISQVAWWLSGWSHCQRDQSKSPSTTSSLSFPLVETTSFVSPSPKTHVLVVSFKSDFFLINKKSRNDQTHAPQLGSTN